MRVWASVLICLTLVGSVAQAQSRGAGGPITIEAKPVVMDPRRPAATRRGDFTYAGGLELHSSDTSRFGGLSDLKINANGRLTAETDDGDLLRAQLVFDAAGHPAALTDATLLPLRGTDGQPLQGKIEGDAEGVAVWPNGDLMVSFERDHRIWLYPADGGPPHPVPRPDISMPDNEGMEGLALAPHRGSSAYWVGVEGGSIWLCHLVSGCVRDETQVRPPLGYRLTALAETEDGDLVVLHHGWDPIRGSHIIAWITRPRPGQPVSILGKLAIAKPLTIDNFEGVETAPLPDGGLRLYFISDDNFSADQRTLLIAYDWHPNRRHPQ